MQLVTLAALAVSASLVIAAPGKGPTCRNLPGDRNWPSIQAWNRLNQTVGGKLIGGAPIAQSCYGPNRDDTLCSKVKAEWGLPDPFTDQPFSVASPYFDNNTCTPFVDAAQASDISNCELGNLASYAIEVLDARSAAAGVKFAREKNIRLIIKNTGHDYLGGSAGKGALALWTHNLNNITLVQYRSKHYTGPAFRIGAGVQFRDLYKVAMAQGLRVVGGSCPTVGAAGGWRQGGGHGPLASMYGLGADNALEFEVLTTDGRHMTASPKENSDLYWALSGGGAGNYAVVLSVVIRAHKDGQVAGSRLTINNNNDKLYWTAVKEWIRHLLVLDRIEGFASDVLVSKDSFSLVAATLPGGDEADMIKALAPFYDTLARLNITPVVNETKVQSTYLEHYDEYVGSNVFTRNITIGDRLIPRSLVRRESQLDKLTATLKEIVAAPDMQIFLLGYNVKEEKAGIPKGFNAITQDWRDSLFSINVLLSGGLTDSWEKKSDDLARVNMWQDRLRDLTPNGGAYINEGTYNAVQWKDDYFRGTYKRLRAIKSKYDPGFVLYTRPGVGSDEFVERPDGHLCRA